VVAARAGQEHPPALFQFSYKQLTNNGIVYNATLAPDGKFFAFVMVQKEKESLRVGQTNSSEQIELRPPAEVSYEGLKFSSDGGTLFYAFADRNSIKFDLYKIAALGGVPLGCATTLARPSLSLTIRNDWPLCAKTLNGELHQF
jgi:hypothetical protein